MFPARLKVFTWHVHGSYLYYLSQGPYDLYIPVNAKKTEGYYGRGRTFPFGDNVTEVSAEEVRTLQFDCIIFQSERNFLTDQFEVLSAEQRRLPSIYLEHNTPSGHHTDSPHILNDENVLLIHVTHYNKLMWKSSVPHSRVIEHGITPTGQTFTGELKRGIVVINHLRERGRVAGWDIFQEIKQHIPIDLVGMGSLRYGGLGEVLHPQLPAFLTRYRFLLNPMRNTSLGLSVLEAMMVGMPIVSLATTEYSTVIRDGYSGYLSCNINTLIERMSLLLEDRMLALELGRQAQDTAMKQFSIDRFVTDWMSAFQFSIDSKKGVYGKNSIY